MTKHKHIKKPLKATLVVTGEDAVNLNLGQPLAYHLPFGCLKHYYSGGIHRPRPAPGSVTKVGHEFYPNIGMFHKPGDRATELPEGSWLSEGVFVGANHYDSRDVLGAHMKTAEGQEMVFASVESINGGRPFAYAIRNFTKTIQGFRPKVQAEHAVARAHSWREKVERNIPKMISSWGEPQVPSTAIYVGSGPSLRHNCGELLRLDYSKASVWAANQAFEYLMKHGVHVDYFFCMDATAFPEWWTETDCSETCLVASPFVNPDILKASWKQVYWYNLASDGFYFNKVRQAKPHLVEIDAHRGVGSAMIESAWIKGLKRVVMAGCDFCYECEPDGTVWRSAGWKLDRDGWRKFAGSHAHYLAYNERGQSVPTYLGLAFEAAAVYAAAQCLWEAGVDTINATEGGILRPNPTARYLAKKVAEKGTPILHEMTLAEAVALVNGLDGK